jgi:hypothetical protein
MSSFVRAAFAACRGWGSSTTESRTALDMSIKQRVTKLERAAASRHALAWQPDTDLFGRIAAYTAYLQRKGPRPPRMPCPPGHDLAGWERQQRESDCVDAWIRRELPVGEPLLGMTEEERRRATGFHQAFLCAAKRAAMPPVCDVQET